jgi:hypothetical protein
MRTTPLRLPRQPVRLEVGGAEALCSWQRIPPESPTHRANPQQLQKGDLRQLHVTHNTQEATRSELVGITCRKGVTPFCHHLPPHAQYFKGWRDMSAERKNNLFVVFVSKHVHLVFV